MENLFVIVTALTIFFIILALYFNKWIKKQFYSYNIEKFSTEDNIGLKWIYTGNKELMEIKLTILNCMIF